MTIDFSHIAATWISKIKDELPLLENPQVSLTMSYQPFLNGGYYASEQWMFSGHVGGVFVCECKTGEPEKAFALFVQSAKDQSIINNLREQQKAAESKESLSDAMGNEDDVFAPR